MKNKQEVKTEPKPEQINSELMCYSQNHMSGLWLCYFKYSGFAYKFETKKEAIKFCDKVNNAILNNQSVYEINRIIERK